MERDGLIVRKTHPADRRAQIIELTQRGRDLEANAIAASEATEDMLLADFRRFERQLLLEYMRRAIESAKKAK
jgi:DNA-binding MarR family transcriptional regulator